MWLCLDGTADTVPVPSSWRKKWRTRRERDTIQGAVSGVRSRAHVSFGVGVGSRGSSPSSRSLFPVKQQAEVNAKKSDGWTPLHLAAANGYLDVVKFLVEQRAEVNAKDTFWSTPVHVAI